MRRYRAYDRIGRTYAAARAPDPRWEARIHEALGDASAILNVGAGTGSYEPSRRGAPRPAGCLRRRPRRIDLTYGLVVAELNS